MDALRTEPTRTGTGLSPAGQDGASHSPDEPELPGGVSAAGALVGGR